MKIQCYVELVRKSTYHIKGKVINALQRRVHRDDLWVVMQMNTIFRSLGCFKLIHRSKPKVNLDGFATIRVRFLFRHVFYIISGTNVACVRVVEMEMSLSRRLIYRKQTSREGRPAPSRTPNRAKKKWEIDWLTRLFKAFFSFSFQGTITKPLFLVHDVCTRRRMYNLYWKIMAR